MEAGEEGNYIPIATLSPGRAEKLSFIFPRYIVVRTD